MQDLTAEFLHETYENLASLDADLVALETSPHDRILLQKIFRLFHMMKGSCGFLHFRRLEKLAHGAESLLTRLRDGDLAVSTPVVTALLQLTDHIKDIVDAIGRDKNEPDGNDDALIANLAQETVVPLPEIFSANTADRLNGAIRVDVDILEELMTLMMELVLTRNELRQLLPVSRHVKTQQTIQRFNTTLACLQDAVMRTRLQPIRHIWQGLPRLLRSMETETGKKIALEIKGAETVLDRQVLEMLKDPFIHLIRNAADHGIETPQERLRVGKTDHGTITLSAAHQNGAIVVTITDDGRGLDEALIKDKMPVTSKKSEWQRLIFEPGFSTRVTASDVSGRGVGLDIVRTNIERIGGLIDIASVTGQGCCFTLTLPLTLAIMPGLTVYTATQSFIVPQSNVSELIKLNANDTEKKLELIGDDYFLRHRDALIPVLELSAQMNDIHVKPNQIVLLQSGAIRFGLGVQSIGEIEDIIVKTLPRDMAGSPFFSAATFLSDGNVGLILNIAALAEHAASTLIEEAA